LLLRGSEIEFLVPKTLLVHLLVLVIKPMRIVGRMDSYQNLFLEGFYDHGERRLPL
jgi:hypothetical protein